MDRRDTNMVVKEFEDYDVPRRKPWLLLVILAILTVVAYRKYSGEEAEQHPADVSVAEAAGAGQAVKEADLPSAQTKPPDRAEPAGKPVDVSGWISRARKLVGAGKLVDARDIYYRILEEGGQKASKTAEKELGRINIQLIKTPRMMSEKIRYVVKRGDSIDRIARKHGTTVELVKKSNGIENADLIRVGDRLAVFTGKPSILVSKRRNDLVLYVNGRFFKRYSVGTGKYGKTPTGTFEISVKDVEPVWYHNGKIVQYTGKPDGENILGTRWMTLEAVGETENVKGYGIHGTWDEASVGKSESAGCVRMRNKDVEELFMLVPPGTPVRIVE